MNLWKHQICKYGIAKSRSISKASGDLVPPDNKKSDENLAYRKKEQADICLNCNKKECSGSEECFKKHAKKVQK